MRPLLLVLVLVGCARKEAPIGPVPDKSSAPPTTPAPPPPSDLVFTDVTCTYGGTAPAFFVWAEVAATGPVHGLRATTFEIHDKAGAFVSGALTTIDLRKRKGPKGEGDVESLKGPILGGEKLHVEVFGPLRLAPFGSTAGYPTDDRPFRVELVAGTQTWTLTGTCKVGPAG